MKQKNLKTSILGMLVLAAAIVAAAHPLFAANQLPVTATANVLPAGVYAPVINANDQTVREGQVLDFEVLASDSNTEDTVQLQITSGQTPWMSIRSNIDGNPARMTVRLAPPAGSTGQFRLYFRATDNSTSHLTTDKDIYITVNQGNQNPTITVQNQTVVAGNPLNFTVNCQDPDNGDTVTLTYSGEPSWLNASTASPATGNPISITFTGTPQQSDAGTCTMTFNAVDNGTPPMSASKQITITVNAVNHPPVLASIRDKEIPARVPLELNLSATDPDSDTLTYSATGLPTGANLDPTSGKFTWTPGGSQVGSYPVRFTVSDSGNPILSDYEDITIYVTADDAPVFDPPLLDKYTKVGKTLSFAAMAKDPNNDPLTYSATNLPDPSATFNTITHTFTWSPTAAGEYKDIMFSVTDLTYTATKTIWIFVNDANAPELDPISPNGEIHTKVGQPLTFGLSASDPDTPQSSLIYSVSNNPDGSSLVGNVFTWTPTAIPNQVGVYRDIIFTVSDGTYTDTKRLWIFVDPGGVPVIERIGDRHIIEGRTLSFTVNATDPDGDPLSYSASNLPVGSYFDPSAHTFTWTPAIGEHGTYKDVRFTVNDGSNYTNEDIWIFVDPNDAPVIEPMKTLYYLKPGESLSFAISAYDPNGDALTYRVLNPPPGAIFSDRTFSWLPTLSQVGDYKDIIFEVADTNGNVTTLGVWIIVVSSGTPILNNIGDQYIKVGDTLSLTISATDPDGDPLTYSVSNNPAGSTLAGQTFTWIPTQAGTYKDIMFTVSDGLNTNTKGIWIFVKALTAPTISVSSERHVKTEELLEFMVTATDPDTPQPGLTFSASNLPPGATFNTSTHTFSWTPTTQQAGTYPDIAFTVSDGTDSDTKWMWIFVTAAGTPVFDQDRTEIYGRIGEPIILIFSATDPEGQALTYSAVNLPYTATFADQTFRWTPQAGQAGTYPDVRVEARDTDGNVASDTFWIFIAPNTPPELDYIGRQYGKVEEELTFTIRAFDPDTGDHLSFTASNLPPGATFVDNGNRTATFTWENPAIGTYNDVHFKVSDGALEDSDNITIIISQ